MGAGRTAVVLEFRTHRYRLSIPIVQFRLRSICYFLDPRSVWGRIKRRDVILAILLPSATKKKRKRQQQRAGEERRAPARCTPSYECMRVRVRAYTSFFDAGDILAAGDKRVRACSRAASR